MIKRSKYMDAYEERVVLNSYRNHILAELIREGHRRGYYVLLLVDRLKHLKLVEERIKDLPHRLVAGTNYAGEEQILKTIRMRDGSLKSKVVRKVLGEKIEVEKRRKIQAKFEQGKVRIILANKVFKKGVNLKRLDVIINGSAAKSKDDALQIFGRGVRLHHQKLGLICFDIADFDEHNKKNWFARASRSRKKAYTQAGLTVKDFKWEVQGEAKELYDFAEKALKQEIGKCNSVTQRNTESKKKTS